MERSIEHHIDQQQIKSSERRPCTCGKSTRTLPNLLCLSFVFNIVFVVLFVVVFIKLDNVQTRLAQLGDPNKLSAREPNENPFVLRRVNSTLSPFAVITANVTTPRLLLQVRAISHC